MKDGWPLSWRHFVYGMAHLARSGARESLRLSDAVQMATPFVDAESQKRWRGAQKHAAGW